MHTHSLFRFTRTLLTAAAAFAGGSLFAGTYTWTGSADGFWTNANNWAEGTVPGQYRDATGTVVGSTNDTVTFGSDALAGKKVTTIDFSGVYSIRGLYTTGTAAYTYGTSATQEVPLEPFGTFSAAETADTPPATMVAILRLGIDSDGYWYGGGGMTIRNNSNSEFVLNDWGVDKRVASAPNTCAQPGVCFAGSGDIRIAGSFSSKGLGYVMAHFKQTGRLIFSKSTIFRQFNFDADENGAASLRRLVIEDGITVKPSECNNCLYAYNPSEISGDGTFYFAYKATGLYGMIFSHPMTISCKVDAVPYGNPPASYPIRIFNQNSGASTLTITGSNAIQGVVGSMTTGGNTPTTFAAPVIGCKGTYGNFGDCTFWFGSGTGGYGAIRYLGTGETMDRDIAFTNASASVKLSGVRLEQYGSGEWTVTSAVSLLGSLPSGRLAFGNSAGSAAATFAGTLADGISVEKRDAGTWTFAPSSAYTNTITVKGGTLRLGRSMHIASLDPASGSSIVVVEDGLALEIDGFKRTGTATVDIILEGASSSVKANNQNAGAAIPGVLVNGVPACADDSGQLIPLTDGSAASWNEPVSGDWTDTTKWAGGHLPDDAHETYLTIYGDSHTVKLDRDWAITNFTLGNASGNTTRLLVTNGATLRATGHSVTPAFLIGTGGRLDVADATVRLEDLGDANGDPTRATPIQLAGGVIDVSGTGALENATPPLARMQASGNMDTVFTFGTGTTTFRDSAVFRVAGEPGKVVASHYVRPGNAGETSTLRFLDKAHVECDTRWTLYELHIGGNGGTGLVEFDSLPDDPTADSAALWRAIYVGSDTGFGTLRLLQGTYKTRSCDTLYVGTPHFYTFTSSSVYFSTGIVEVASGVTLEMLNNNSRGDCLIPCAIGHSLPINKNRTESCCFGRMTVAGTFQVDNGSFTIGTGPAAIGEFVQTGGIVRHKNDGSASHKGEFAVGLFGGQGCYTLEDGTFSTVDNAYIGGATTNDLHGVHKTNDGYLNKQHDAEGLVAVNGGSFTVSKKIILGADGSGWLALTGTGLVSAASIVVSNTTGQASSGLRFVADAQGRCGQIASATKFVFSAGAQVAVDVSAYAATAQRSMTVWDLATAPEGLGNATFTLTGNESGPKGNSLSHSADGRRLVWKVRAGTVLIVR